MTETLAQSIMLYYSHPVRLELSDGEFVDGILTSYDAENLQIDEVTYAKNKVQDIFYIGKKTYLAKEEDYAWMDSVYRFAKDDCVDDAIFENLLFGEFNCEVLCHLVLRESIIATDVRLLKTAHNYNEGLLLERGYLYFLKDKGYCAAQYATVDEGSVLQLLTGEVIPFSAYDIIDITKLPEINNHVWVQMEDRTEHEGIVTVSAPDSFVLANSTMPVHLYYNKVKEIRYIGYVGNNDEIANRRYHIVSREETVPQHLPKNTKITYHVSMNSQHLLAKNVRAPELENEDALEEHLGIIYYCDMKQMDGVGYIGTHYVYQDEKKADRQGHVAFARDLMKFPYSPYQYVYVVRYVIAANQELKPGKLPDALSLELVEQYEIGKYDEITILPDDTIQAIPYNEVLYGVEYLLKKTVEVTCVDKVVRGCLASISEEALFISKDAFGREPIATIQRDDVTQLRAFGRITSYTPYNQQRASSGCGYIDTNIFFHISSLRLSEGDDYGTLEGLYVSFRLMRTNKNNRVAATEIFSEQKTITGYVVGGENGVYRVVRKADYSFRRTGAEIMELRANPNCKFADLINYDYKVSIRMNGGSESKEEPVIEDVLEQMPKLQFGYILKYFPKKEHGYFISEENYQRGSRANLKGMNFELKDIQNLPPEFDTWNNEYYISYRKANGGRKYILSILETTPLKKVLKKGDEPMNQDELQKALQEIMEFENGQAAISQLNDAITLCLKENQLDLAEETLARYQDAVDREDYLTVLCRIYDKKYKDSQDPAELEVYTTCIEELLSLSNKTPFNMRLLLRQGDLFCRQEAYKRAGECYTKWESLCRELLELFPEKRDNYRMWQQKVARQKELCNQNGGGAGAPLDFGTEDMDLNVVEMTDWHQDIYLQQRFGQVQPEKVLTEESYADILESLRTEDKEELRMQLFGIDENSISSADVCWSLAKLYNTAVMSCENLRDAEKNKYDMFLYRALLLTAREELLKTGEKDIEAVKRRSQYLCALAVKLLPKSDEALAVYFAKDVLMDALLKERISTGRCTSLPELIAQAPSLDMIDMDRFLYDSIILAAQDDAIKETIIRAISSLDEPFKARYGRALCDMLERQMNGDILSDVELNEGVNEVVRRYGEIKNTLTNIKETRMSLLAAGKLAELTDPRHQGWLSIEEARLERILHDLRNLEEYENLKGFDAKSRVLTIGLSAIKKTMDIIEEKPSCLAFEIFMPLLQELYLVLKSTYTTLCLTTRPQLQIGSCDDIYEEGQGWLVHVPVYSVANSGQAAMDVRLKIEASDKFTMLTQEIEPIARLLSDGEIRYFSFRIQPTEADCEYITLRAQLSYQHIAEVQFEERGKRQRAAGYQEKWKRVVLPYKEFDVMLRKEAREPIESRYIELFDNGHVTYNEQTSDILKNREESIQDVLRLLTEEDAEGVRKLRHKPTWVALYGQWRVGKTTILHEVERRLNEFYPDAYVLFMECPSVDKNEVNQDFKKKFAEDIYDLIRTRIILDDDDHVRQIFIDLQSDPIIGNLSEDISWGNVQLFLRAFSERYRKYKPDGRIVLFVDEFTRIYHAILYNRVGSGFLEEWRDYFEKNGMFVITAGGEHTVAMLNAYVPNSTQKTTTVFVDNLTPEFTEEYVRFVIHNDDYFGSAMSTVMNRIYKLTQGNVYLLYNFCRALVQYVNKERIPYISVTTLYKTINEMVAGYGNSEGLEGYLFNSLYNPFNEGEKKEEISNEELRLPDDEVLEDNKRIMHAIVKHADRETHICVENKVASHLFDMPRDVYERRLNMLIARGVVKRTGDLLQIPIDLFYEIVSRGKNF